ncbi:ribonuclease P protein subunit POP4 [Microdochium nivale]|nr:ribonuclease P protein subunit POP4 [Microdochium nivale]
MAGSKPDKTLQQSLTHSLLARAHSPDSTQRIFTDKIQHRPFLIRPSSPPPVATSGPGPDARAARRVARRRVQSQRSSKRRAAGLKPEPLSARERRRMGLYDIRTTHCDSNGDGDEKKKKKNKNQKKQQISYSVFEPLHALWLGYIREILGSELFTGGQAAAARLASADIHGARVRVSRSSCPSRVGIEGIVVRDSRYAVQIVTRKNTVKLVPKEGTMFRVEVPARAAATTTTAELVAIPHHAQGDDDPTHDVTSRQGTEISQRSEEKGEPATNSEQGGRVFVFEILGDQFQTRSADRANRKFRAHFLENL